MLVHWRWQLSLLYMQPGPLQESKGLVGDGQESSGFTALSPTSLSISSSSSFAMHWLGRPGIICCKTRFWNNKNISILSSSFSFFGNCITFLLLLKSIQTAFTTKKDYGKGEREAQWATAQRTLHGLQPPETMFNDKTTYRELNELAEQAKKRAEVAR